ncbi:MAG: RcpC/CpaB family pilus assembly protein [Acidimicrobiia bacterium]|nr:MAG: RcpC/CpaB family pilus assembly protein [Acidimicrobiia bacterium]
MRRSLGIVVALGFAILGTLLLIGYVRSAEERALAGEELVEVLVVQQAVAAGTPASLLDGSVTLEQVPLKVRAEGGVADLEVLGELVASTDLLPGEQITAARFVTTESLEPDAGIEPPSGTIAVTVSLFPERAVGGQLRPGDQVAVIASFKPFDLNYLEPSGLPPGEIIDPGEVFLGTTDEDGGTAVKTPTSTHLILHGVIVTNVQLESLPRVDESDSAGEAPALAPTGNLLITLAAQPHDVERLVFAAEHGTLWLAFEPEGTPATATEIVTRSNVYE